MAIKIIPETYEQASDILRKTEIKLDSVINAVAHVYKNIDYQLSIYIGQDLNNIQNKLDDINYNCHKLSQEIAEKSEEYRSVEKKTSKYLNNIDYSSPTLNTTANFTSNNSNEKESITNQELSTLTSSVVDTPENAILNFFNNLSEPAKEFINSIESTLSEAQATLASKAESLLSSAEEGLINLAQNAANVAKKTGASVANTAVGLAQGVSEFGEALVDTGAILCSAVATPFTALGDGIQWINGKITGNENWNSVTADLWTESMDFVGTKHVTDAFDSFHQNNAIGKWLDENAYSPFKSTGAVYKIADGVGYIAGIIALTLATMGLGGAAAGAGAAGSSGTVATINIGNVASVAVTKQAITSGIVATTAGFGKNTQNAWSDGATLSEGLTYGLAYGTWEGLEMFLGAEINSLKILNASGLSGQLLTTGTHVALDSIDGASAGFINPLLQMIYKPNEKSIDPIMYIVNHDDNGNQINNKKWEDLTFIEKYKALFEYNGGWSTVATSGITAGAVSILSEVPDVIKAIKNSGLPTKEMFSTLDSTTNNITITKELEEYLDKYLKHPEITAPAGIPKKVIDFIDQVSKDSSITYPDGIPKEVLDYISSKVSVSSSLSGTKKALLSSEVDTQTTLVSGPTTSLTKATTPDYFEQLRHTEAYEASKFASQLSELSQKYGLSEAKLQTVLDNKLKELVDTSDFCKRTRLTTLEKMLDTDGFMKTQFETGSSGGAYNPKYRKLIEQELFAIPMDIEAVDRPLYGMCIPQVTTANKDTIAKYITSGPGSWYGGGDGCVLVFDKSKVIDSSTISIGDSLDYYRSVNGTPAINPQYRGGFEGFLNDTDTIADLNASKLTDLFTKEDQYLEVQLHGQATHSLDNIKEVIFTTAKPSQELLDKLAARGISWQIL